MRPRAPSGFSKYKRIKKMLVGAVGSNLSSTESRAAKSCWIG